MKKYLISAKLLLIVILVLFAFGGRLFINADPVQITPPIYHSTFQSLLAAIIAFIRNLALAVTPIIIIVAGYYFMSSGGNPEKVKRAKQMVIYALIGLVIILLAESIVALIRSIVEQGRTTTAPTRIENPTRVEEVF